MQVIKKLITPAIFCLLVVAISIYFYAIPSLGIENIDERTNILIPIFFTSAGLIVTIILISIVNFIDLFLNYFKNRSIEKTRFIILNVLYFGFIFTCSMLCTLPIIIFLYSDLFILDWTYIFIYALLITLGMLVTTILWVLFSGFKIRKRKEKNK